MLFSSMIFLWVFLPAVIIVNFILSIVRFSSEALRIRVKNAFLLAASLFFYAWGGLDHLLVMLGSILVNYLGGLVLGADETASWKRKAKLILILAADLGSLFVFKFGITKMALPIGISFFTFQAMSYVIDVYRKKAAVQKSIFNFALYVSFFPQLVAGPIVKYGDIESQLRSRKESISLFVSGQKRFCYGMGKKVLLANTFAEIADHIWGLDTARIGTGVAWLGILAYTLQIYYDFSGYSDMAIGIGRMLGFSFKENFDYPYTALSVREFWRRWHISLSSWFKEYVYIPLGGNRHGNGRACLNLFIVFLLTGIWHGADFTFLVWGIFYAVLQIIERLFLGKVLEKNPVKPLNWLYCIFCVMAGWVFFRSDTVFQAVEYLRQMFAGVSSEYYTVISFLSMKAVIAFVIGILFAGFVQRLLGQWYGKIRDRLPVVALPFMACDFAIQMGILVLSVLMLVSGTYNPFIYFQF